MCSPGVSESHLSELPECWGLADGTPTPETHISSRNGNSPHGTQKVVIKSKDKAALNRRELLLPAEALSLRSVPLGATRGP